MAAHGTSAFENDNAADLLIDIHSSKSWSSALQAIALDLEQDGDLLDCMNAEFTIAAIALILAKEGRYNSAKLVEQCSQIGAGIGDDPNKFLERLPPPPSTALDLANTVLDTVFSKEHALNFAWSETELYDSWAAEISYVKEALAS